MQGLALGVLVEVAVADCAASAAHIRGFCTGEARAASHELSASSFDIEHDACCEPLAIATAAPRCVHTKVVGSFGFGVAAINGLNRP